MLYNFLAGDNSVVVIEDSTFFKNQATDRGGAIFFLVVPIRMRISRCTFDQNVADGMGGAIAAQDEVAVPLIRNVTIHNSSFIRNEATGEVMEMQRINGVYEIELAIEPYATAPSASNLRQAHRP